MCRNINRASGSPTQGKDSAVTAAGPGVAQVNPANPNAAAPLISTQNNGVELVSVCVCLWPLTFTQPVVHTHSNTGYPAVSLAHFQPQRPQCPQACDTRRSSRDVGHRRRRHFSPPVNKITQTCPPAQTQENFQKVLSGNSVSVINQPNMNKERTPESDWLDLLSSAIFHSGSLRISNWKRIVCCCIWSAERLPTKAGVMLFCFASI